MGSLRTLTNRIKKYFKDRIIKYYSRNCYQSIDELCIFYWNRIQETGNLSYLIRSESVHIEKRKVGKLREAGLKKLWRKLLDEYILRFGFSDNFLEICRLQKEILNLKIQRGTKDDKTVNIFIKIAEEKLISLQQIDKGSNFYELKGALDRAGFDIRPMETSVAEFFTHVQTLVTQSKANVRPTY